MKLSLCIPTYNRASHLLNCLNSINIAAEAVSGNVEVCVSDNASSDTTEAVVSQMNMRLPLKYHRNAENLGIPRNFLKVVAMAEGEFVWLLGDDDLLLPDTLVRLLGLLEQHTQAAFFYVNAYHLTTEYVLSRPQPFDTSLLPEMERFSKREVSGEIAFLALIDPKISFDFLGGMFLSVFKRCHWVDYHAELAASALSAEETFSHFDNTFPHIKIFANAFSESCAYFNAEPLVVCLTGAREWAPMYPFVRSVRLVEALRLYRDNGLPFLQYIRCRNVALRHFIPDVVSMLLNPKQSGLQFVRPWKHFLSNLLYPNVYLSAFFYCFRRVKLRLQGSEDA